MSYDYKHDLFYGNMPIRKDKIITNTGFLNTFIKSSFIKHFKEPFFVWTGTNTIPKLEDSSFLNKKIFNKLRKQKVHFFLYEPGCYYSIKETGFNRSFYSEFAEDVPFVYIRCDALDCIEEFAKKYKLDITVHTGDYGVENIQKNYNYIKLDCFDLFVREQAFHMQGWDNQDTSDQIVHKFWCGNWRYTPHRHLTAAFMSNFDSLMSWHLDASKRELENVNWLVNSNLLNISKITNGIKKLQKNEYSLEFDIPRWEVADIEDSVIIPNDNAPAITPTFIDSYKKAFCAIVTETRYAQPFSNISEKVLSPIALKRPFILVAPPNSLNYLKKLGFKTFDKWWNEQYDVTKTHDVRIQQIFGIIEWLDTLSVDEMKNIYEEMREVLDHNAKVLGTLVTDTTTIPPNLSTSS
jgi:hypothetical protein